MRDVDLVPEVLHRFQARDEHDVDLVPEVGRHFQAQNRHKHLNAGPYQQKQTLRRQGYQIDPLLRTRRSLYVFEIKFRKRIAASIVDEVREKVRRLKLPKGQSVRTGLIYCGEPDPEIDGRDDFDFLVPAEKLLTRK